MNVHVLEVVQFNVVHIHAYMHELLNSDARIHLHVLQRQAVTIYVHLHMSQSSLEMRTYVRL